MASLISENIKNENSFKNKPFLNILIKSSKFLMKLNIIYQKIYLLFFKKKISNDLEKIKICNGINFNNYKDNFQQNGYIFIENFLDQDFVGNLKKDWPKKFFFRPKHQIEKSYDVGFKYLRHYDDVNKIQNFYYLDKFYNFLISKKFSENISKLNSDKYNMSCYSISSSIAYGGSCLFPHKDDITVNNKGELKTISMLNCIFFIYASPNHHSSGGTSIYKDNEFLEPVFVPSNLINSVLIYKTDKNFFHGFKEIPKKSFRYAIAAQYNQAD